MTYFSHRDFGRLPKFKDFLRERGAEVLAPTSEWEVFRFAANKITSIIYRNKVGAITMVGEAEAAWTAFRTGQPWAAKGNRVSRPKLAPKLRALIERDGDRCFYCALAMLDEDISLEHLVAVAHGGPNHLSNLVLAHKLCNANAGTLSAPEKIRLHVEARLLVLIEHERQKSAGAAT